MEDDLVKKESGFKSFLKKTFLEEENDIIEKELEDEKYESDSLLYNYILNNAKDEDIKIIEKLIFIINETDLSYDLDCRDMSMEEFIIKYLENK